MTNTETMVNRLMQLADNYNMKGLVKEHLVSNLNETNDIQKTLKCWVADMLGGYNHPELDNIVKSIMK